MAKKWRPEVHPRDPRTGEFVEHGGGWVAGVSDAITSGRGQYTPVRGRDIRDELDMDALAQIPTVRGIGGGEPDLQLAALYKHQGFDGKPEVVDGDEMDRRVAAGWTELWRGVDGVAPEYHAQHPDAPTSADMAEAFRHGDYWPGLGVRGNGTYTSPHRTVAHGYTQREGEWYGPVDDSYEIPGPAWPGLIRMALRPDARTVEWDEMDKSVTKHLDEYGYPVDNDPLADEGHLATAMGYDAIIVRGTGENRQKINMVVVLNRTAVAVQEAWQ